MVLGISEQNYELKSLDLKIQEKGEARTMLGTQEQARMVHKAWWGQLAAHSCLDIECNVRTMVL